jgi:hypothetical protein
MRPQVPGRGRIHVRRDPMAGHLHTRRGALDGSPIAVGRPKAGRHLAPGPPARDEEEGRRPACGRDPLSGVPQELAHAHCSISEMSW